MNMEVYSIHHDKTEIHDTGGMLAPVESMKRHILSGTNREV